MGRGREEQIVQVVVCLHVGTAWKAWNVLERLERLFRFGTYRYAVVSGGAGAGVTNGT